MRRPGSVRSPVFVARKNASRCCSSHGASRSSESPYDGRRVDVVDAVREQQLERRVRFRLRDVAERRGAEDRAGALVAGPAERRFAIMSAAYAAATTQRNPTLLPALERESHADTDERDAGDPVERALDARADGAGCGRGRRGRA